MTPLSVIPLTPTLQKTSFGFPSPGPAKTPTAETAATSKWNMAGKVERPGSATQLMGFCVITWLARWLAGSSDEQISNQISRAKFKCWITNLGISMFWSQSPIPILHVEYRFFCDVRSQISVKNIESNRYLSLPSTGLHASRTVRSLQSVVGVAAILRVFGCSLKLVRQEGYTFRLQLVT